MFGSRLLFGISALLLVVPVAVVTLVRPRWVSFIVLAAAVVYTPYFYSESGNAVDLLVAAFSLAALIIPLLTGGHTVLTVAWQQASGFSRTVIAVFLFMLGIATLNTWLSGSKAAGTAVVVLIWPVALAASFGIRQGRRSQDVPSRFILLKHSLVGSTAIYGLGICFGKWGALDVTMTILAISAFGCALDPSVRFGVRVILLMIAGVSSWSLWTVFSDSSSLLAGLLLSFSWLLSLKLLQELRISPARIKTFASCLILGSILIMPVITLSLYYGRGLDVESSFVDRALKVFGETEWNLFNRPARWEPLIALISREPFRLKFTNFEDVLYFETPGNLKSAQPHNIIVATGCYTGVPGMLFSIVLAFLLTKNLIARVGAHDSRTLGNAFGALGVVVALLFRNMWSLKLFAEPVEIFYFSLAVLTCFQIGDLHSTGKGHKLCSSHAQGPVRAAEIKRGESKVSERFEASAGSGR